MNALDRFVKRIFDVTASVVGLLIFLWLIAVAYVIASIDTRRSGFFRQIRVGRNARLFNVIKIRTMKDVPDVSTTVTQMSDPRVTRVGSLMRKAKIDELPQLVNVLLGQMSFVGPRPDVPGFADKLKGDDRIILSVRPGITGPASLKYRHEEYLLETQSDPERYNRETIYPDKVLLNKEYIEKYRFRNDIKYIYQTLLGWLRD